MAGETQLTFCSNSSSCMMLQSLQFQLDLIWDTENDVMRQVSIRKDEVLTAKEAAVMQIIFFQGMLNIFEVNNWNENTLSIKGR